MEVEQWEGGTALPTGLAPGDWGSGSARPRAGAERGGEIDKLLKQKEKKKERNSKH